MTKQIQGLSFCEEIILFKEAEPDFNRIIEIKEREAYRVKTFMGMIDQHPETIVFCATQAHAAAVRDLINQMKDNRDRITAFALLHKMARMANNGFVLSKTMKRRSRQS